MRGATPQGIHCPVKRRISIHAPHAGRDMGIFPRAINNFRFQSTRPMRGATSRGMDLKSRLEYFNPRAPCGARLSTLTVQLPLLPFQSTRPMRGATSVSSNFPASSIISIHAPHAGRDWFKYLDVTAREISIHAPHAGRDVIIKKKRLLKLLFQSTRPMRGATAQSLARCNQT